MRMSQPSAPSPASAASPPGAFAPLAGRVFLVLWVATVIGNVGSFIRDTASAWIATDLSASPAAIATVQAAATLPVFLLAIPAGVLSDILDRRRFLIVVQVFLGLVSLSLMLLSAFGAAQAQRSCSALTAFEAQLRGMANARLVDASLAQELQGLARELALARGRC